MSEKFSALLAACATTLVMFASTAPATAKDRPITVVATGYDVPVRYVSYRDLDLATVKDENRLVIRVRHATKEVCIESGTSFPLYSSTSVSCRAEAWQGARPQIKRAVKRARQIAANGWSAIAPVAITISVR